MKGWDYQFTGKHKPQKVKNIEEALVIVRKQFGETAYKQGATMSWTFFLPGYEQAIAEYFPKTKYNYLRMLPHNPEY